MLSLSTLLKHYKRSDVQQAMVASAQQKEVAVRFGEQGFGKRPDTLTYPQDVLEFAKQGATSFHVSEERWQNPLQLAPGMKRKDMDALRAGWDLVLDIDCKLWEYSKRITQLLVQELQLHGVRSISCKFSGNKGFHIGVPFEAFPTQVHGKSVKDLFPEGVRRIAVYLTDKIRPKLLSYIKQQDSLTRLSQELGSELSLKLLCTRCKKEQVLQQKFQFICQHCEATVFVDKDEAFKACPQCKSLMQKIDLSSPRCKSCGETSFIETLDISALLQVDTVLISSRHLYRMPYSLHEKAGLVSIPCDPYNILTFDRSLAKPETISFAYRFLDTATVVPGEASRLLLEAFDYQPAVKDDKNPQSLQQPQHFDELQQQIPADLFPPCMKLGLAGLKDGKKRFLFAATNFLKSAGYSTAEMTAIFEEWNKKNPEQLREVILQGHLRYQQQHHTKVLPPNCDNKAYYVDIGICQPDPLCRRIKNPFQYAKRKAFLLRMQEDKGKEKLTNEQKEMRKKFRDAKAATSSDS